jgi:hypothetical protein
VDVWSFEPSVAAVLRALEHEGHDEQHKGREKMGNAALLLYNLATALVLCGETMPLVIRETLPASG